MCDLLDAAACLAGVPLLALVAVHEHGGGINPKAWKEYAGPRRDAIINRSQRHQFSDDEFAAIGSALRDLADRGNSKAWQYVHGLYPGDLLYRRLIEDYAPPQANAIDDLGTDTADRTQDAVWSYDRDPQVRGAVLQRANGRCEYCGKPGFLKPDGTRYVESHHVIALANDGADRVTNVIALCPSDHREAHFGARSAELEQEMIRKLRVLNS
jgi:hypothetical protein